MSARIARQLVATMPARIGLLADILEAIRGEGVNMLAISAYERDGEGKFLIVTEDNQTAADALNRFSGQVGEKDVLLVEMENKAGALGEAARALAEGGVNIEYVYGTTTAGDTATVVFKTSDDLKALSLL